MLIVPSGSTVRISLRTASATTQAVVAVDRQSIGFAARINESMNLAIGSHSYNGSIASRAYEQIVVRIEHRSFGKRDTAGIRLESHLTNPHSFFAVPLRMYSRSRSLRKSHASRMKRMPAS